MGSNLVIAAIPDENDPVWKVSSEKIPHLTVLFLGETKAVSNLEQIMLFVEHAANTSLKRFYLPVDRRGELGDDKADVLFFKKGRYDFKAIRDFRATLLQDQNIKTAYDSAEQFEGPWTPHLTLGYPETPAKPVPDGMISSFYDVQFNKIAVWTGDFEGPDWLLKDYWDEMDNWDIPMDVSMSALAHYGKKGMKWGVRNVDSSGRTTEKKREGAQMFLDPQGHDLTTDVAKTAAGVIIPVVAPLTIPAQVRLIRGGVRGLKAKSQHRQEQMFEKHANSAKNFVEIHNGAHEQVNKHIAEINKKYPQDLTKDPKAQKQYDSEITKGLQDAYRTSANQLGNKTGTRHLDVEFLNDGLDFKIVAKEGMQTPTLERVVHAAADDTNVEFTGKIKRDSTGHIIGLVFDDFDTQSMAQTAELGLVFLEHYGVKGQKWGVRKEQFQSNLHARRVSAEMATREKRPARDVRALDTIGTSKRKQSSISTKGGEDHPPTPEAISVAVQKQKIKKSGVAALSNNELQEVQRRLNLENDVKRLMVGDKTAGQRFIEGLLGRGSKEDRKMLENQAGQKARRGKEKRPRSGESW
jgi:2'-5' RNA ligase